MSEAAPPPTSPVLQARFEIDAEGAPKFSTSAGRKTYHLVFELKDAPPDTYAASFEFGPGTYDPVRTIRPDDDGAFRLKVATDGDSAVVVKLRTRSGEVPMLGTVRKALLSASQRDPANPALAKAFAEISER